MKRESNDVAWGPGPLAAAADIEHGLRQLSLALEAWKLGFTHQARALAENVCNATARRGSASQDTALAKLSDGAGALARVFYHLEPRR